MHTYTRTGGAQLSLLPGFMCNEKHARYILLLYGPGGTVMQAVGPEAGLFRFC